MEKDARIYVAGHTGLLGSAIIRRLKDNGYADIITKAHSDLDLTRQAEVEIFFKTEKPQYIILAAAKVGGIQANISYPAQFLYENLQIQSNIIHSSYLNGVKKLLFFGSACSYPVNSPQPMREEYLLSGRPEATNEAYAVAKISGIKMCQAYNRQYGTNFICAIPANIYGPNDNFNPRDSHVIPALLKRFHEAKIKKEPSVIIWGTGRPLREFIYADDVASACVFLMRHYNSSEVINIGTGEEVSIAGLARLIKETVGFGGEIVFAPSRPDGAPRKVLDIAKLKNLGWEAETALKEGIEKTYQWYVNQAG